MRGRQRRRRARGEPADDWVPLVNLGAVGSLPPAWIPDEELRVARDIQTALLPAAPPDIPGWDLAADWRSARLVGGDFYDFWRLPLAVGVESLELGVGELVPQSPTPSPQLLGFVVADVSDKGVPAAMFMTLSRSLMRAAALDGSSPSVALGRANRWITRDSDSAMFVTLFYGILDLATGALRYSCAGHNPPLLFRAADLSVVELTTPGIALGVLEDVTLDEAEVTLEVGDVLVCYTDGLTEAINAAEEAFGVPRLIDVILERHAASAVELVDAINAGLRRFTERVENYNRQHLSTDDFAHVNFGYIANVARVNAMTVASLGTSLRTSSGSTMVPPPVIVWKVDHCAAPCMNGGIISSFIPPPAARACSAIASYDACGSLVPNGVPPIEVT